MLIGVFLFHMEEFPDMLLLSLKLPFCRTAIWLLYVIIRQKWDYLQEGYNSANVLPKSILMLWIMIKKKAALLSESPFYDHGMQVGENEQKMVETEFHEKENLVYNTQPVVPNGHAHSMREIIIY